MRLRLGSRGSALALAQSGMVGARLRALGHRVEVVTIVTEGDTRPSGEMPGEGVFVAALERALMAGEVDLAVHSAKDMPLDEHPDLVVGAFPERADPRDALVTARGGAGLASLPAGCRVGTDSPRRAGFLLALRPDLAPVPSAGNVDTRLRRLDGGAVEALVLASAGLDRLGLGGRIDSRLDPSEVMPAPGQGALAVQARADRAELLRALAGLDRPEVRLAVEAERRVLEATGGTCRSPVGALGRVSGSTLELLAAAVTPDGRERHAVRLSGPATVEGARRLGAAAGAELAARVSLEVRR